MNSTDDPVFQAAALLVLQLRHEKQVFVRLAARKKQRKYRKWRIKEFENHLTTYPPYPDGVVIVRVMHEARAIGDCLGIEIWKSRGLWFKAPRGRRRRTKCRL